MLFEIYEGKERKFCCEDKSCIPETKYLKTMSNNGYRFKVNGKVVAFSKLKEALKNVK